MILNAQPTDLPPEAQAPYPLPSVHPGKTLEAEMKARGLSANSLALKIRVPANRLSDIVRGRRAVSAETALRLARAFGTSPQFWLNLQSAFDLSQAEALMGEKVRHEVEVLT